MNWGLIAPAFPQIDDSNFYFSGGKVFDSLDDLHNPALDVEPQRGLYSFSVQVQNQ